MIDAEDLQLGDEAIKGYGQDAQAQPRAVHNAIAEACGVDATALENFINHNVTNMSRFAPMDNDMKSLVAVVTRHCFAVGVFCARREEAVIDA